MTDTAASISARTREFDATWESPRGWRGVLMPVQHKVVGTRYMVTAFAFFLLGGLLALLMRIQLAQPENDFLGPQTYNELFTMHGTTMMFLFAVPFLEGLATYLLPLMIGARDMPFPRYNMFNYWCYLIGGLVLYSSFVVGMVPDAGWFSYVPLSGPEFSDKAMDIWLFGLTLAEIAAIGAAIEIIVAVLKTRAPGMSLDRLPIFAWTMLSVAVLILVAFVPLLVASVMLELDRSVGTAFFDHAVGGDPLLWQHLFWIFGHPEVYVMFLPGAAIISHVIPVHARHPLVAYPFVVTAVIVTAIMSLGLWVHHMYTVGLPPLTLSFFTAASMSIALASGLQVMAWLATLWLGRPRMTVPMLYAVGFVITFVAGGITGVMVASAPFDAQAHDSYFVVAHFHYVLIGGMLFPIFAALYHWWPKFTGRMPDHRWGHVSFWLVFVGFHTTFFPMHLMGLWGMPRRVYTYGAGMELGTLNLLATVGAFVLATGVLVLTVTLLRARRSGPPAPADPWGGDSLEWTLSSPTHSANFPAFPTVASRHPGWDPEPADDRHAPVLEALDHGPVGYRVTPLCTVVTGQPDGVARLPRPSAHPVLPALGLLIVVVGLLLEIYWLAVAGVGVVLVGLWLWALRNEAEEGPEAAEPIAGLPAEALGSRALGWWAAVSGGAVLLVAMSTVAFSGLFLQVSTAVWPPGPTLDRPLLSLLALLTAGLATAVTGAAARRAWEAERDEASIRARQLLAGAVAGLLGLVGLVAVVLTWTTSGLDPRAHAYNSVALVSLSVQALGFVLALGGTAAAVLGRVQHRRETRARLLLQNAALLWGAVVLASAIGWATTDLLPHWVI